MYSHSSPVLLWYVAVTVLSVVVNEPDEVIMSITELAGDISCVA